QCAGQPAFETQVHEGGVLKRFRRAGDMEKRPHLFELLAGGEAREMHGMRTDVAYCERRTYLRWVETPGTLAILVRQVDCPLLKIFNLYLANIPQHAVADQLACLPHHGMGGIGVGDAENKPGGLLATYELERVIEVGRQRLVRNDVDPGVQ